MSSRRIVCGVKRPIKTLRRARKLQQQRKMVSRKIWKMFRTIACHHPEKFMQVCMNLERLDITLIHPINFTYPIATMSLQ
jgi:hypothetical protein